MRLFTLEHCKTIYLLDFAFYCACVLFLAIYLLLNSTLSNLLESLLLILIGLLTWTAMEYCLHRFVLHGLQPFKSWHTEHHKRPNALICLPTILSAILIIIFVFTPTFILFGIQNSCALTLGMLIGYLTYSIIHHGLHQWKIKNVWLKNRRRWHGRHHHVNQSAQFGVTNSFWDYVFDTE